MARRKIPKGQINRKNKQTVQALVNLMEDLGQKYSIRVGIIGDKAYEKHPHTDLTMAELGAIHEFGATIQVTEKMRAYLHHIGIHLKPETTTITIPARSFLRATLLNSEAKRELLDIGGISQKSDFYKGTVSSEDVRQYNKAKFEQVLIKDHAFFMDICKKIGFSAQNLVRKAFEDGGYPNKWLPISEVTKRNRRGNSDNEPLTDTGALRNSISYEVKEVG